AIADGPFAWLSNWSRFGAAPESGAGDSSCRFGAVAAALTRGVARGRRGRKDVGLRAAGTRDCWSATSRPRASAKAVRVAPRQVRFCDVADAARAHPTGACSLEEIPPRSAPRAGRQWA